MVSGFVSVFVNFVDTEIALGGYGSITNRGSGHGFLREWKAIKKKKKVKENR